MNTQLITLPQVCWTNGIRITTRAITSAQVYETRGIWITTQLITPHQTYCGLQFHVMYITTIQKPWYLLIGVKTLVKTRRIELPFLLSKLTSLIQLMIELNSIIWHVKGVSSVRVSIHFFVCIIHFYTSLSTTILVVFIICNHYLSDISWHSLCCIWNRIPPAFLSEVYAPVLFSNFSPSHFLPGKWLYSSFSPNGKLAIKQFFPFL